MKKLSLWAKHHKWQARLIITIAYLVLIFLGIITGFLLGDLRVTIPYWIMYVFILMAVFAAYYYPGRRPAKADWAKKNAHYRRQKTCDGLLVAATFLMVMCIANEPRHSFRYSFFFNPVNAASVSVMPKDSARNSYLPMKAYQNSMQDDAGNLLKWKERKKRIKTQVKAIRKANDLTDGQKIALILLAVLIGLGIGFGIVALSCNLTCGGSALGSVALVCGVGLLILAFVLVIKKLSGKKKKVTESPPG